MCKLFGARGGVDLTEEQAGEVYDHLAGHYKELDKEVPIVEIDEFKDIDWKEDEKFILECSNLDGSLQSSINILKYFLKEDRIKSIDLERIRQTQTLLEEINPQGITNIPDGKILINETDLDEFLAMCKTLKGNIANVKKFDINEVVVNEFKKALAEATGKEIK